eukprot:TRINITY_DN5567_c1_g3_i2.p1 TRINITY_DN5567_c1_g3~~TRINITY_DN5567_c1_g3_i2.p1  ORF type:complete len:946 (+),score=289.50 TRINITY_DN5567_c1_g3_i2:41-2878(+)
MGTALQPLDANAGARGARRKPRPAPVSAVRKLVSATGRGCQNVLVNEPGSLVGRTCRSFAWVGGADETKCVVEMNRNRHTFRERPVLRIEVTAHTARSCPRTCTVLTNAEPHGAFQTLHQWDLRGGADAACVVPMVVTKRYICIRLSGGSGHNHRIARLEIMQEAESGPPGGDSAAYEDGEELEADALTAYPVFTSPALPKRAAVPPPAESCASSSMNISRQSASSLGWRGRESTIELEPRGECAGPRGADALPVGEQAEEAAPPPPHPASSPGCTRYGVPKAAAEDDELDHLRIEEPSYAAWGPAPEDAAPLATDASATMVVGVDLGGIAASGPVSFGGGAATHGDTTLHVSDLQTTGEATQSWRAGEEDEWAGVDVDITRSTLEGLIAQQQRVHWERHAKDQHGGGAGDDRPEPDALWTLEAALENHEGFHDQHQHQHQAHADHQDPAQDHSYYSPSPVSADDPSDQRLAEPQPWRAGGASPPPQYLQEAGQASSAAPRRTSVSVERGADGRLRMDHPAEDDGAYWRPPLCSEEPLPPQASPPAAWGGQRQSPPSAAWERASSAGLSVSPQADGWRLGCAASEEVTAGPCIASPAGGDETFVIEIGDGAGALEEEGSTGGGAQEEEGSTLVVGDDLRTLCDEAHDPPRRAAVEAESGVDPQLHGDAPPPAAAHAAAPLEDLCLEAACVAAPPEEAAMDTSQRLPSPAAPSAASDAAALEEAELLRGWTPQQVRRPVAVERATAERPVATRLTYPASTPPSWAPPPPPPPPGHAQATPSPTTGVRSSASSSGRARPSRRAPPAPPVPAAAAAVRSSRSLLDCVPDMGPADRLLSSAMKALITSNIDTAASAGPPRPRQAPPLGDTIWNTQRAAAAAAAGEAGEPTDPMIRSLLAAGHATPAPAARYTPLQRRPAAVWNETPAASAVGDPVRRSPPCPIGPLTYD